MRGAARCSQLQQFHWCSAWRLALTLRVLGAYVRTRPVASMARAIHAGHLYRLHEVAMTIEKASTVIKKYANRRLYHTGTSAYVTLDDLAEMVRSGEDFVVQDAKTGEDITRGVLGQIIFDAESKGGGSAADRVPAPADHLLRRTDADAGAAPTWSIRSPPSRREQDKLRQQWSETRRRADVQGGRGSGAPQHGHVPALDAHVHALHAGGRPAGADRPENLADDVAALRAELAKCRPGWRRSPPDRGRAIAAGTESTTRRT